MSKYMVSVYTPKAGTEGNDKNKKEITPSESHPLECRDIQEAMDWAINKYPDRTMHSIHVSLSE